MSKGLRWRPPRKAEILITPLAEEGRRTRLVQVGPVRSVTKDAHKPSRNTCVSATTSPNSTIVVKYVPTNLQRADLLTKPPVGEKSLYFVICPLGHTPHKPLPD